MTRSRTWTLGTVLVVMVVFVAGWFLVISPKRAKAAELKQTAVDTAEQNVSAEATVRQLKLQQKEVPAQQAAIEGIKQQIPDVPDQPGLIRQLSSAADVAGVDLKSIAPTPPAPLAGDAGVTYMATAISVQGSYPNLKLFLDKLERNKRAIMVTGFSVSKVDDATSPDQLSMAITTRVFIGTIANSTTSTATASPGATAGADSTAGSGSTSDNAR